MEFKLEYDGSYYYIEINGVRLPTELHYHEANLIQAYMEENAEKIREAVLRK